MRRFWFYVKNNFSNFHKILRFRDALSEKIVYFVSSAEKRILTQERVATRTRV